MQTDHSPLPTYVVPEPLRLAGRYLSDTAHIDALPTLDTHELAWAAGFGRQTARAWNALIGAWEG